MFSVRVFDEHGHLLSHSEAVASLTPWIVYFKLEGQKIIIEKLK